MKIFTVADMIATEKAADAAGISYRHMMETAGRHVAYAIIERLDIKEANILILVGPGNNGGDGLVAGRYLAQAGADVAFYLTKPRDPLTDENYAQIQQMGLFIVEATFDQRFRVLRTRLNITDIVIDALLGTGVSRPIQGPLAQLLLQVKKGLKERQASWTHNGRSSRLAVTHLEPTPSKQHRPTIIAVDCPSGLHCDTGTLDPLTIPAHLTITFAGPKRGHFRFPGAEACGELVVADIDIPSDLPILQTINVELATANLARTLLPPRPLAGHKGTFGKVLIVAGSHHYWGAPVLAGRAAYRAGAGLVALAVPQTIRATVATQLPEATYPPLADDKQLTENSAHFLFSETAAYKATLIGPGLAEAHAFVGTLLNAENMPPLVVDADGLNTLATLPNWHQRLPAETILTPHPGEMARLMGISLSTLKTQDRVTVAQESARQWGHIVLLKGAYTVIAAPNGHCTILPFANPILGTAGSGDVLAGLLVGLLAQGMKAYEAAVLGGYLHAAAGQLARNQMGNAGLLAGELADWIPQARQTLQS